MAGDARCSTGTVSAPRLEEDRLDGLAVTLEAERLLSPERNRDADHREGQRQASGRESPTPGRAHGITAVWFRFGVWPTLIRAISSMALASITDTSPDPAFATYR